MNDQLIRNHKFEKLLPELSRSEFEQLRASVLREGIREPIKVWKDNIVDGYNRHFLATEYDLPFAIIDMDFADEDAACEWILMNQLGRRNLDPNQKTLYIGQLYEIQKKRKGEVVVRDEEGKFAETLDAMKSTAEILGEEFDVSPRTVMRAGAVAQAFDQVDEETQEKFKKGEVTQKELVEKVKPETKKEDLIPADPHLNNIIFHAKQISAAAQHLAQKLKDYQNYIHFGKVPVESFAPILHDANTQEVLDSVFTYAKALKHLETCPDCNGQGCQTCSKRGYLTAQDAAHVKKYANKTEDDKKAEKTTTKAKESNVKQPKKAKDKEIDEVETVNEPVEAEIVEQIVEQVETDDPVVETEVIDEIADAETA